MRQDRVGAIGDPDQLVVIEYPHADRVVASRVDPGRVVRNRERDLASRHVLHDCLSNGGRWRVETRNILQHRLEHGIVRNRGLLAESGLADHRPFRTFGLRFHTLPVTANKEEHEHRMQCGKWSRARILPHEYLRHDSVT